ncbi:MAG: hypothetical protein J7M38_04900 [Armatimonadetes bacterium]|nr:hypothetical protein [Armatimonadota bacterium]
MSKRINIIVAVALMCIFPVLTIYSGLHSPTVEPYEEQVVDIATGFLMESPTFRFDGIDGSIKVIDVVAAESYPIQYYVYINFTCAHAGYGDRTGWILAQVITDHTAVVVVSEEEVQGAVIDGVWDEYTQTEMNTSELLTLEDALNIVVDYLRQNYAEAEALEVDDEWSVSNETPEGLLGVSLQEYRGCGWVIKVRYPIVWKPIYMFEVSNEAGFTWSGQVDQNRVVMEN